MLVSVLRSSDGGHDFKVRLAGEGARSVFGNIADKLISKFFPPEVAERWRFAFEAVSNQKAPLRNCGTVAFKNMNWLDYEVLVAPLGDGESVSDLFVVFVSWRSESHAQ